MDVLARDRIDVWTCRSCGQAIDGTICITCGDKGGDEVEYVRADLHQGAVEENRKLRAELEGMRKQNATHCIWHGELQERIRELEAAGGR